MKQFTKKGQTFTGLKLKLLMKSKPELDLRLLKPSSNISRNFKVWVGIELVQKSRLNGVANLLNSISSGFGEISLMEFRDFGKETTFSFRFFSLSSSGKFAEDWMDIEGINSIHLLQDFSSYKYTDKLLYSVGKGIDIGLIYQSLSTFGVIKEFKKASMKKFVVQYDDERALDNIEKFKREEDTEMKSLMNILGDPIGMIIHSCWVFKEENRREIFFEQTNPYKLRTDTNNDKENISHIKFNENFSYQNLRKENNKEKTNNLKFANYNLHLFATSENNSNPSNKRGYRVPLGGSIIGSQSYQNKQKPQRERDEFKVDLDKIISRFDTRTTFMIRNIPNAYLQKEILRKVDRVIEGMYDFFYLPIDFVNLCNLGYAFINVINEEAAVRLIQEFDSKKWPMRKSSKICKIKYARIQGRNKLINHFKRGKMLNEAKENLDFVPFVLPNSLLDFTIF